MAKNAYEKLQEKIDNITNARDKSREKRRTEQNYEIEHIKICKGLANDLIKYVRDNKKKLSDYKGKIIPGLENDTDTTIKELMEMTKDTKISVIEKILKEELSESVESIFRIMYGDSDNTIKVIGLIEDYLVSDLKSDLTEEFAWYFDYIRNIMTDDDNGTLLEKVKNILNDDIQNNKNKEQKVSSVRKMLLNHIGKSVNENQNKYGFPNAFKANEPTPAEIKGKAELFTKDEKKEIREKGQKQKTKGKKNNDLYLEEAKKQLIESEEYEITDYTFKKATGGLPDVVSITPEGKVSFTAANSLTSLQMEYDQIERHSAVIALGIYTFERDNKTTLEDVIQWGDEKLKKKIGIYITQAFENNKGNKGQRKLYESLNEPKDDRLKNIKDILNDKIDVTFFQTYTSKNVTPLLLNDLIAKEKGFTEDNKPIDEEMIILIKEKYREVNHMTSFLLGNAQTAYNQKNENYKKELMENNVKAINLRSQPKTSNNLKTNNDLFTNHIIEKLNSKESIGSWLNHLVKVEVEATKIERENQDASILLDVLDNNEVLTLLNMEYPKDNLNQEEKTAIAKIERQIKIGNVEDHIRGLNTLYSYPENNGKIEEINKRFTANKLNKIRKAINEKIVPIETLDKDKSYNIIDMSMINMLRSSDTLRTAALIGVTNVLKEKALNSNDLNEIDKIEDEYKIVIEYSKKTLNNYSRGDSQIISDNLTVIGAYARKLEKKKGQEKDLITILKDEKLINFLEEKGKNGRGNIIYNIKEDIKLNDIIMEYYNYPDMKNKTIEEKKKKFKEEYSILYEEFKSNEENRKIVEIFTKNSLTELLNEENKLRNGVSLKDIKDIINEKKLNEEIIKIIKIACPDIYEKLVENSSIKEEQVREIKLEKQTLAFINYLEESGPSNDEEYLLEVKSLLNDEENDLKIDIKLNDLVEIIKYIQPEAEDNAIDSLLKNKYSLLYEEINNKKLPEKSEEKEKKTSEKIDVTKGQGSLFKL